MGYRMDGLQVGYFELHVRIKKAEVGGRRTLDLSLCVQPYFVRSARRLVQELCAIAPNDNHQPIGARQAILLTDSRPTCICPV